MLQKALVVAIVIEEYVKAALEKTSIKWIAAAMRLEMYIYTHMRVKREARRLERRRWESTSADLTSIDLR